MISNAFDDDYAVLKFVLFSQPNNVEVLPNGLAGIPNGLERLKAGKVSAVKLVAHPFD